MSIAHHIVRYRFHLNLVTALLAAIWLGWAAYQLSTIGAPVAHPTIQLRVPASDSGGNCCTHAHYKVTALPAMDKA